MASASCVFCRGLGLRSTSKREFTKPCGCVFRSIFRACYNRFRRCTEKTGRISSVTLDRSEGPVGLRFWGRKNEEFIADFQLICRRSLNQKEHELFQWHFLYGADWKLCVQKLSIDKGEFFHRVYSVQEKLGRVFREVRPHALFPLDEYFGGVSTTKVKLRLQPVRDIGLPLPVEPEEQEDNPETKKWLNEIVAETNVIEMPRRSDTISHRFPTKKAA